jgi:hypothetical protein
MAPITISLSDIESLTDRLLARAKSRLLNHMPDLQADLLLAGRLLTHFVRGGTVWDGPLILPEGQS